MILRCRQFSLKTLLAFFLFANVIIGAFAVQWHRAEAQRRTVEKGLKVGALDWRIYYDYEVDDNGELLNPKPAAPEPKWLLDWLGRDFFHSVVMVDASQFRMNLPINDKYAPDDSDWEMLESLTSLRVLNLRQSNVKDYHLKQFSNLRSLTKLNLEYTAVGDEGLRHLSRLSSLRVLSLGLGRPQLTGRGLKHLGSLDNLLVLDLAFTNISDEDIVHLMDLNNLERLNLADTDISDKALKHLSRMKNLHVLYLTGTVVSDDSIPLLQNMCQLRELNIEFTDITEEGAGLLRSSLPDTTIYSGERLSGRFKDWHVLSRSSESGK